MRKIAVLTSGGDAPGMNAAVRAVARTALDAGCQVIGVSRGYAGLLDASFVPLDPGSVGDIIHRGGTILKTARSQPFTTKSGQERAIKNLRNHEVDGLCVIGGDGSLRGAAVLAEAGVSVVGVPASIDNDLYGTDFSIGFDTTINTVISTLDRIRDTASSHERIFVVEVMGRSSGQIALAAGLAGGAESVLIPEMTWSLADVVKRIQAGFARGKRHSLVLVAEGAGKAEPVSEEIGRLTGLETRFSVLGHMQRGGSPSASDRILASQLGSFAVRQLLEGQSGVMVGIIKGQSVATPLAEVMKHASLFPQENYSLLTMLAH